ncbi:hypothetical protein ACHAW5_004031 [Stephanodiscus triporus]|uniref:Nuclear factor of kappa light polypeptide gene enhancer in B-cells inhibitor-like 1 n=1 Tax=Stephanodiscus triporus TaxID=2934178 RepID=A0ABD3NRZ4_9STRA
MTSTSDDDDDDDYDDENVPLNGVAAREDGDRRRVTGGHDDVEREEEEEEEEEGGGADDDDDEGAGCPTRGRRFGLLGRYGGYRALGRVSLHDPWDYDAEETDRANDDDDDDDDGDCDLLADDDDDDDVDRGGFVSFWRRKDRGDVSGGGRPNNLGRSNQDFDNPDVVVDDDDCDEDRVETTMRPIPLLYRKYRGSGGLGRDATIDPRAKNNNFGLWFQRELGIANFHFAEVAEREASSSRGRRRGGRGRDNRGNNGPWNLWKRQETTIEVEGFAEVEDFESDEDEGGDANSLISSSSSNEFPLSGMMACRVPRDDVDAREHKNNIFGGRGRRGGGIMALPIIRPFLRGSRRGSTDNSDTGQGDEEDDSVDYDADGLCSRRDRAAVIQSISQGIVGTTDESLLVDANYFGSQHNNAAMIQLHNIIRREDWSLATTLLETKPELAQTWHHVSRLYGGRYDGEALPIHAAVALCPPPSFVEMLATLYPGGLLEKDKAFGRVPLHVACRCLASSGVIRVLCERDPKCVEERDDLKRVPLHYLLKNTLSLNDDDDNDALIDECTAYSIQEEEDDEDGMIAMKILIKTNPNCVRAADHRGWLPLHVACGSSSRKGMLRVITLLLRIWPESVLMKTDRGSDALDCVDFAGKHHPTKDRVIALLQEARCKVNGSDAGDIISSVQDEDRDESEQDYSSGESIPGPTALPSEKQIDESRDESYNITSSYQKPDDDDDELIGM